MESLSIIRLSKGKPTAKPLANDKIIIAEIVPADGVELIKVKGFPVVLQNALVNGNI
mgnify:CR=1 FL=1